MAKQRFGNVKFKSLWHDNHFLEWDGNANVANWKLNIDVEQASSGAVNNLLQFLDQNLKGIWNRWHCENMLFVTIFDNEDAALVNTMFRIREVHEMDLCVLENYAP